MTLDKAIERYTSNAEYERTHGNLQGCLDFRQLAEWLTELKKLREQTRWIPVSERLPEEKDGSVFVKMPDRKVRIARYSEFNDTWYVGDMMGVGGPEPIAWMPLSESYEPQESEDKE